MCAAFKRGVGEWSVPSNQTIVVIIENKFKPENKPSQIKLNKDNVKMCDMS